jgi:protein-tyrosine phosphatase
VDRHIAFERLHNVRDLGGYPADGGTVAWGRVYRADNLAKLHESEGDRAKFADLKIKTVIDLRYDWEIAASGRMPEYDGIAWRHVCLEHRTYDQALNDVDVDPVEFFHGKHHELATDSAAELRETLGIIAAGAPVLFHCKTGKDRTGYVAAVLLALLGVSDADIAADYALTNLATARFVADWTGGPIRWPGYATAPAESMRRFLHDVRAAHGSIGAWAAKQGIDDALVAALREGLVEK